MNLYEIDSRMTSLIDPVTGEIMDYEAFEALAMEREAKLDNVALWIKDLDAEQAALDTEARKLMERRDAARRKRDRLKEYLQTALNGEKRSTAQYAITYRNTESVEVADDMAASEWLVDHGYNDYVRVKVTTDINKVSVKDLLKKGVAVPGIELKKKQSMTIK